MPKYALIEKLARGNLVKQIAVGIVAGIVLALVWPTGASGAMLLGHLFVQALKAVAIGTFDIANRPVGVRPEQER